MTNNRLTELNNLQVLEKFSKLAEQAGSAVLDSESNTANKALKGLWAIEDMLKSSGSDARLQLLPLLDHKNRFVRYYAAQALLALVPERARAVIEWNAKYWFDALAGDARGLLRALDTGAYRPD